MASLHRQTGSRPGYKLRFRDSGKRQRILWLGDVSKRSANEIMRHVTELAESHGRNVKPDVASVEWANSLTGRIRQNLAKWGYVAPERETDSTSLVCSEFFETYIQSKADWSERSTCNYRQAVRHFNAFMGNDRLLNDVLPPDIDAWRVWMIQQGKRRKTPDDPGEGLAAATANRHAKRIRTLFNQAIRAKLVKSNPVDGKIGDEVNRERDFYVSREVASKFVKQCNDDLNPEWALIFGLCRYCGFRCPTEVLRLTWADVDWENGKLRVDSQKTGLRYCPIFPEVRPLLEAVFEQAPEGTSHCIRQYHGAETNLRTQFLRFLNRAGIPPWPKPFVNLRASCRTDLQELFPSHVCDTWLGHSSRIANKHYLQTTDLHWERALKAGGNTGGNISANLSASREIARSENPAKTAAEAGGCSGDPPLTPTAGFEPATLALGKLCSIP